MKKNRDTETEYPGRYNPNFAVPSAVWHIKEHMVLMIFNRDEDVMNSCLGRNLWPRGYCLSSKRSHIDQMHKYVF